MAETAARDPQLAFIFRRPFDEQVAFFRAKLGRLMPTATWEDLWKAQHDRAFAVAGAATQDLLADLASAVDKALTEGETLQQFRARFGEIVQRRGWQGWTGESTDAGKAWRTRVIYETNLSTSYAAGRLAQLKKGEYPFWIYKHSDVSVRPRPQHLAWDGLVLPVDHRFWQQHFPPNGWGCLCRAVGVRSAAQARRLGGDPDKQLPQGWNAIDPKTGAPVGIDEGWDYQPGATAENLIPRQADELSSVRETSKAQTPLPPPRVASVSRLLPEGQSDEFYVKAFLDEFGIGPRETLLYQDQAGEYVAISDALFFSRAGESKADKRGRGRFLLLLADTIRSPDEIRVALDVEHKRLRRRYIARWQVEGEGVPALVVFEWSKDQWVGITALTAKNSEYLERRGRIGEVIYQREVK